MHILKNAQEKKSSRKTPSLTPGKTLFVKTRKDRFPSWKFHQPFFFSFLFSAPGNIIILVSEIIRVFPQLDPWLNQICSDDGPVTEYTASAGVNLLFPNFAFVHKSHFRPFGSQITAHAQTFFCSELEDYFTDCLIIR